MFRLGILTIGLASLTIIAAGCGEKQIPTVTVSGKVTYDGKPLPAGQIAFVTTSTKPIRFYGGEIKDGAYTAKSEVGDMIIKIAAERDVAGKFLEGADGTKVAVRQNYIPAKFNEQSELKYKVPSGGASDANFDLKP